ncbi:MAG: 50S ribosomal protein L10 [Anaerolineae bacterium]
MAISRARKEELLDEYRRQMDESTGFMMAEYTALSVPQMQELRRQAHERSGEVFVVKNTLFGIVLKEAELEFDEEEVLTGPIVVAFCHEDVPPIARLFRDFAGDVEEGHFVVKGGMLEERIFGPEEAATVADLPTREELLAQVLRTINAPATQMAGVVASGIRQVMNVVKAYADKLEEEAGGAPAEAAA